MEYFMGVFDHPVCVRLRCTEPYGSCTIKPDYVYFVSSLEEGQLQTDDRS